MKNVLLFGTFDLLHEGHKYIFKQLNELGYNIIICLAQDEVVKRLKTKEPVNKFANRKKTLENTGLIKKVIKGDDKQGKFSTILTVNPDVIAVGYDQNELQKAIEKWMTVNNKNIPIIKMQPFNPKIYKSSLLRNKI
jgi:cytidyltransferase-like protein